MKANSIIFTLALILLSAFTFQVNAQETRVLQENEITESVIIDTLAPEKMRTKTPKLMDHLNQPPALSMAITFNTNSAELTYRAKQVLDKVGSALNMDKLAEFSFVIEGHTDLSGSYQLNQRLSKARAETVMNYLVQVHGIEPNRLTTVGKSYIELANKDNPLAPENRRVTLIRK